MWRLWFQVYARRGKPVVVSERPPSVWMSAGTPLADP
jgi:hypothetical protein